MKAGLPKILGLVEATTVVVGSMIGSGIFLKAAGIAQILPHPGLILLCWLAAGLLTLSGALVIAELSARFPGSGGPYLFLREGFGPRVAFLFGWSLLAIIQSGSIASLACGVAKVVASRVVLNESQQHLVSYACIASLTALHCISVNAGARWLQNVVTSIKYLGLLWLVGMGIFAGQAHVSNLQPVGELPSTGLLISALGVIMLKALWAYDGWANATFIAGEVREAQKNLPRALIGGTIMVMLIYLATNATYHLVLTPQQVAGVESPAVAVTEHCIGPGWAVAIAALQALAMFGTLNSSILSAPRVYFAMAQSGQFPDWMAAVNRFQTPYVALTLQGIWAVVLIAIWKDFEKITDNVMFVYWTFYALTALCALRFPPPETGYRAPARTLLVAIFVSGAGFMVISQLIRQPAVSLQALVLLGVGMLFYRKPTDKVPEIGTKPEIGISRES
ncbi:amino acid permease [bacterium]|nr:amino acid permease [bacterium]